MIIYVKYLHVRKEDIIAKSHRHTQMQNPDRFSYLTYASVKSNCAQPSAPLLRANRRANRRALVADHLTFEGGGGGAGVWVISEKDIQPG